MLHLQGLDWDFNNTFRHYTQKERATIMKIVSYEFLPSRDHHSYGYGQRKIMWLRTLLLFNSSVMSNSLQPHGLQHTRHPCPSPSPGVCSHSWPLSRWCHPTIPSSVIPLPSCHQSFPASGFFQMNQFFASGGQSIGASASASVLPVNIQGWLPLGSAGLISLQLRDSQESSPAPQFKGTDSSALCLLYSPALTSINGYWKNHNFDYVDLCRQSNVSAF